MEVRIEEDELEPIGPNLIPDPDELTLSGVGGIVEGRLRKDEEELVELVKEDDGLKVIFGSGTCREELEARDFGERMRIDVNV